MGVTRPLLGVVGLQKHPVRTQGVTDLLAPRVRKRLLLSLLAEVDNKKQLTLTQQEEEDKILQRTIILQLI